MRHSVDLGPVVGLVPYFHSHDDVVVVSGCENESHALQARRASQWVELDGFSSKANSAFQREVKQGSNPRTWRIYVPYIVAAGQYWWHGRSNRSSPRDLIR